MERFERPKYSVEDWKGLLQFRFAGSQRRDFSNPGIYSFSVTPGHLILLANKPEAHGFLAKNYGADLNRTWAEGYVYIGTDGRIEKIDFKPMPYQSLPAFKGTAAELVTFHKAIGEKITESLES